MYLFGIFSVRWDLKSIFPQGCKENGQEPTASGEQVVVDQRANRSVRNGAIAEVLISAGQYYRRNRSSCGSQDTILVSSTTLSSPRHVHCTKGMTACSEFRVQGGDKWIVK